MSELPPKEPESQTPLFYEAPKPSGGVADWIPITALVLGCFNLVAWVIPLCGCPFGIAGIVLGAMGIKSQRYKTMSIIGLVLSVLSMVGTVINAIIGAYMGMHRKF